MILPSFQNRELEARNRQLEARTRNAPPVEVAHVRAFVEAAHVGRRGVVLPGFDSPKEWPDGVSAVESGYRGYGWNGTDTAVDVRTQSIVAYNDHADEDAFRNEPYIPSTVDRLAPRRVSDAEAAELAQGFHEAARSPYGVRVFSVRDRMGNRGNHLSVSFTPTWRGVAYDRDNAGYAEIGRDDGCLRTYLLHALATPLPTPPATLVPQASANAARLAALRGLSRLAGVALAENPRWPFALAIGAPATKDMAGAGIRSFLGPEEAARVAAGAGRLVYSGQFVGGDPDDHTIPRLSVMVDALDGRVLSVRDWAFGRGGPGAKGSGKPLLPSVTPRSWRVMVGETDWTAPAKVALVPTADPAPTGTKVTLTDGRAAFPATYDPKTGLLGIQGKAYRPGPALADLLRRRAR